MEPESLNLKLIIEIKMKFLVEIKSENSLDPLQGAKTERKKNVSCQYLLKLIHGD